MFSVDKINPVEEDSSFGNLLRHTVVGNIFAGIKIESRISFKRALWNEIDDRSLGRYIVEDYNRHLKIAKTAGQLCSRIKFFDETGLNIFVAENNFAKIESPDALIIHDNLPAEIVGHPGMVLRFNQ